MLGTILVAAVALGVVYAVKHHITVAQAKAEAEAVVTKVKLEIAQIESEVKAEEAVVIAKVTPLLTRIKSLL